ncbi:MAG: hypothetical protein H6867_06210 [Rhodospirillales bacterium]|nr:hypothetical protein [Rhodospirillales bacterium]MCB9995124.1 hypothetical protein [Rhodospirillales bacterium]
MFFIPNLRKGVTVVGLLVAFGIPWLISHGPELWSKSRHEVVPVPVEMQLCTAHEQCGYVETACSSCCRYEAINKDYAATFFEENFNASCQSYHGAVCDCVGPGGIEPVCVKGRCQLKGPDPVYND